LRYSFNDTVPESPGSSKTGALVARAAGLIRNVSSRNMYVFTGAVSLVLVMSQEVFCCGWMMFSAAAILTVSYVDLNRGQGCSAGVRDEVRVARKAW
jgi:hypothetical protein